MHGDGSVARGDMVRGKRGETESMEARGKLNKGDSNHIRPSLCINASLIFIKEFNGEKSSVIR